MSQGFKENPAWLIILLLTAISALAIFALGTFTPPLERFLDSSPLANYKQSIYEIVDKLGVSRSSWLERNLAATIGVMPLIFVISIGLYLLFFILTSTPSAHPESSYQKQLSSLDEARNNLKTSLEFVNDLRSQIVSQQEKYLELKRTTDVLEETSKESVESLQKKLEAIAIAEKTKEIRGLVVAFLLGFFASLLASAVWQFITAK